MTPIIKKHVAKPHKAPQPPLSHRGATPDSDRAKKPPLAGPSPRGQQLNLGDRVEGLGDFGKPTGEFGTVQQYGLLFLGIYLIASLLSNVSIGLA